MYRTVQCRALRGAIPVISVFVLLLFNTAAFAQDPAEPPPPPPPGWTGSFGAGLALTQGNSDTSTINGAYEMKRDAGGRLLFKSTGLFLRGETEGELTANRLVLDGRGDYQFTKRTAAFAQLQYLTDEFKEIDYLISPTVGIAQQLVKNERTELSLDGGFGLVSEKNEGFDVVTTGALTAGQNFKHRLTATTEVTQKISTLWKTNELSDALFIFGAGMAVDVTTRIQLKAEVLDTFKSRPPSAEVQRNDVAVLLSFVYKYE